MREPRHQPTSSERVVVVGDSHGDWRGLRRLLEASQVIDSHGHRRDDVWCCHVGDVIHGGHGVQDDDVRTLELALEYCDSLVLGNHELPFVCGLGGFVGQNRDSAAQQLLNRSWRQGRWTAAASADGYLITHAGLHPALLASSAVLSPLRSGAETPAAEAVAADLHAGFEQRLLARRPDPIFDAIGRRRGGRDPQGGIFWCDWLELMAAEEGDYDLCQIVGHSPQPQVEIARGGRMICVDVGPGRSAAVVRDPGQTFSALELASVTP